MLLSVQFRDQPIRGPPEDVALLICLLQGGRSLAWWARCGRRQREVGEGRQLQLDVILRRWPSAERVARDKDFAAQPGPRAQVVGADRPRARVARSSRARGGALIGQHRSLDQFMCALNPPAFSAAAAAAAAAAQQIAERRLGIPLVACRRAPGALLHSLESNKIGVACRQKATWGWPLPSWRQQGEPLNRRRASLPLGQAPLPATRPPCLLSLLSRASVPLT